MFWQAAKGCLSALKKNCRQPALPDQPLPTGCHHLPRQNIHIPLVRTEYSGSCLKLCAETAERRIAGDVVRVGYGEDCVDAAVAGN